MSRLCSHRHAAADVVTRACLAVCREIFYVHEEMLCVPKLYVPITTCMLRVINNDTGAEIPRVFQKVAPYVYKKNDVSAQLLQLARILLRLSQEKKRGV